MTRLLLDNNAKTDEMKYYLETKKFEYGILTKKH
jgi:hypothetical protein